jgi:hypothetical protein
VTASLVVGRTLPPKVMVRLPTVFVTMHGAWGVGFLTSPRQLGSRPESASLYSPYDGQ